MASMSELTLLTDEITLVALPGHGGDLHSLTHTGTGVDVLFKPQWTPSGTPALGGARPEWLADYRGGWQVLLPNAGDECERDGHVWGFHGEASTVPWTVESIDASRAELSVRLNTAPLEVHRVLTLSGATVRLDETVSNLSDHDTEVMYVHHPAFGLPLISAGARLDAGAHTVLTDPEAPGSIAEPGTTSAWPQLPSGTDLREVPGEPRTLMAYLTDFTEPYYAVTNPALGLGVGVRWNAETFPHAWLWQELRHTPDVPWRRKATAMAVEPATTFPGYGLNYVNDHGSTGLVIRGRGHVNATVEMTIFVPPSGFTEVTGVDWGGQVTCPSA